MNPEHENTYYCRPAKGLLARVEKLEEDKEREERIKEKKADEYIYLRGRVSRLENDSNAELLDRVEKLEKGRLARGLVDVGELLGRINELEEANRTHGGLTTNAKLVFRRLNENQESGLKNQSRIDGLEKQLESFPADKYDLPGRVTELEDVVGGAEEDLTEHVKRIEQLENTSAYRDTRVSKVVDRVRSLEDERNVHGARITRLDDERRKAITRIEWLENTAVNQGAYATVINAKTVANKDRLDKIEKNYEHDIEFTDVNSVFYRIRQAEDDILRLLRLVDGTTDRTTLVNADTRVSLRGRIDALEGAAEQTDIRANRVDKVEELCDTLNYRVNNLDDALEQNVEQNDANLRDIRTTGRDRNDALKFDIKNMADRVGDLEDVAHTDRTELHVDCRENTKERIAKLEDAKLSHVRRIEKLESLVDTHHSGLLFNCNFSTKERIAKLERAVRPLRHNEVDISKTLTDFRDTNSTFLHRIKELERVRSILDKKCWAIESDKKEGLEN